MQVFIANYHDKESLFNPKLISSYEQLRCMHETTSILTLNTHIFSHINQRLIYIYLFILTEERRKRDNIIFSEKPCDQACCNA